MRLRFVSERLVFESGGLSVWYAESLNVPEPIPFAGDVVEDLDLPRHGLVCIACVDCCVRIRSTGNARVVPAFYAETVIDEAALSAGQIEVALESHAFIQVSVVNARGGLMDGAGIGLALPTNTIERTTASGRMTFLLPPGQYLAYVLETPNVREAFTVRDGDDDLGELVLRAR